MEGKGELYSLLESFPCINSNIFNCLFALAIVVTEKEMNAYAALSLKAVSMLLLFLVSVVEKHLREVWMPVVDC